MQRAAMRVDQRLHRAAQAASTQQQALVAPQQPCSSDSLQQPRDCQRQGRQDRCRRRRNLAAACCLLLAAACLPAALGAHVQASKAMRNHIQQFAASIPLGRDYLAEVPDGQRVAWSQDLGLTINETLHALNALRVPIKVDVKLVGFSGDGNEGLHLADHDLLVFLKTLHAQLESVALHPSPGHMPLRPEVSFRVQPAYFELAPKVAAAINQGINTGPTSNAYGPYRLHLVPHAAVDDVIADDAAHTADPGAYTIYLLNPPAHAPYAYTYPLGLPGSDACPGSLWVSDRRYAWFDLTANLTFVGPGPGGKGQVFAHATPILRHYKPDQLSRAILPDLAALAWSACQHLVWPPLHHGSLQYSTQLEVHLLYLVDELLRPSSSSSGRVDVGMLQAELQSIGSTIGQQVAVKEHYVLFAECPSCVTAYAGALQAKTSRQPGSKGAGFRMATSSYLELPELERWLREWRDALLSDAGVPFEAGRVGGKQVLPVFIFDVPSAEPVLLDGLLQAAALPSGDVVAVRSAAQPTATFFGCFEHTVTLDPASIHRPVLAAVLQQAYGVADTALSWSPATGKAWSFLWSVGQTPFGPLAATSSLSFAQRDAAVRNLALAYLNSTINHASLLVRGFQFLGPGGHEEHVKRFLQPQQVIPYQQRLSLLLFKLNEAAVALGSQQQPLGLGYALSAVEDVSALHSITRAYKASLNPDLICMGTGRQGRWWAYVAGAGFLGLALLVWRLARGAGDEVGPSGGPYSRRGSAAHHRAY